MLTSDSRGGFCSSLHGEPPNDAFYERNQAAATRGDRGNASGATSARSYLRQKVEGRSGMIRARRALPLKLSSFS